MTVWSTCGQVYDITVSKPPHAISPCLHGQTDQGPGKITACHNDTVAADMVQ